MCTTIYGSVRDFRMEMRNPFCPARAHAICRQLVATASQNTKWYGVHYWAACAATSHDEWLGDSLVRYRKSWYREAKCEDEPTRWASLLWDKALARVMNKRAEALKLKTSVLW